MINHIVFFSSGAASWFAAKRVARKFGVDNLYLVFADTGIEDEDNYRFLVEAAENVGGQLIWLKDPQNRTPWDVFFEKKFISHRASHCSIELKVKPCERWIKECEFSCRNTILYFGIGFEEIERMQAISKNWSPFKCDTPLCWDDFGWADREAIFDELKREGLTPPRLYGLGFSHANCGGFCPKAGLGHYRNLLDKMPERYLYHEQREQEFRELVGKDVSILRKVINGETKSITLREWRMQIQSEPVQMDLFDEGLGGCGCFIEDTHENEKG